MGGKKGDAKAVAAPAPAPAAIPAEPEAPAMPKMGVSQILPMVLLLGMNKFDPEKMGYTRHVEIGYVIVQILCLGVMGFMYTKIQAKEVGGAMVKVKAVTQFGSEVKPASEQTEKEYDNGNWREQMQKLVMGAGILGCIYYKWGYLTPLVLQLFMTPSQLIESELFSIYVRGKDMQLTRLPFCCTPLQAPSTFSRCFNWDKKGCQQNDSLVRG